MPTVGVWDGFRVMVYPLDHEPAHVHVYKGNDSWRVVLDTLHVNGTKGKPTDAVIRQSKKLVKEHMEECRAIWKAHHG